MGAVKSVFSAGKGLANLLLRSSKSKVDRDKFDRAFSKYPPTASRTWGFQNSNAALYANDSWFSTQKRIRMSEINRFIGLRPYPAKPAGKAFRPGDYNLVWGNPERYYRGDAQDQNYSLQFLGVPVSKLSSSTLVHLCLKGTCSRSLQFPPSERSRPKVCEPAASRRWNAGSGLCLCAAWPGSA